MAGDYLGHGQDTKPQVDTTSSATTYYTVTAKLPQLWVVSFTQAEHILLSMTSCTRLLRVKMLSQKLTRITLKISDFEEYEQLKREHERDMDTSQSTPAAGSRERKTSKSAPHMSGGIEGRRPVRASTPEPPLN